MHRCRYCDDIGSYNIVYACQVLTLFFIPVWRWNKTYFAEITYCHKIIGSIGKGFIVLIGACASDTKEIADKM